jgi:hypothetical protein
MSAALIITTTPPHPQHIPDFFFLNFSKDPCMQQ